MDAQPAQAPQSEKSDDAICVQVAAVIAQQAALTEQEIRLADREEAWQAEREAVLGEIETLVGQLTERDALLDEREAHLEEQTNTIAQLTESIAWLESQAQQQAEHLDRGRQLLGELGRTLAAAEGHHADIRKALMRIEHFLGAESRPLARAA